MSSLKQKKKKKNKQPRESSLFHGETDPAEERKEPGIKIHWKKKTATKGRIMSPFWASTGAHVPEFTLAGQTCLSIPNRESLSGKRRTELSGRQGAAAME